MRAYTGDIRGLVSFAGARGVAVDALELSLLRSWLAAQAGAGAARSTLARRTSTVKTFTAWAARRGLLASDPGIRLQLPKTRLNGSRGHRLPGNLNISFEGIEGESLLLRLDMAGICASSGSACTSGSSTKRLSAATASHAPL